MANSTRDAHVAHAKKRAYVCFDQGKNGPALATLIHDLRAHPETKDDPRIAVLAKFLLIVHPGDREAIRRCIEEFD